MTPVLDFIRNNRDLLIGDLRQFMQQPSVAIQNLGMAECADLLCRQMAAFGMAPPRPMPARKRNALRPPTESTSAIINVRTPNTTTQPMSVDRRPKRSPARPPRRPPIIMPNGPTARGVVKSER